MTTTVMRLLPDADPRLQICSEESPASSKDLFLLRDHRRQESLLIRVLRCFGSFVVAVVAGPLGTVFDTDGVIIQYWLASGLPVLCQSLECADDRAAAEACDANQHRFSFAECEPRYLEICAIFFAR